jgi:hypothetical protein
MGIRFYCPNGHKLNVKNFQAGQVGICPYCGAKTQIPLQSVRPSSKQMNRGVQEAVDNVVSAMPKPTMQSEPSAVPASPSDPLVEAGDLVWYARPPSGGQFGPANASIMRTWLAENRISEDTLVWREGWRDWQMAGDVFPQLAKNLPPVEPINLHPQPIVPVHASSAESPSPSRNYMPIVIGGLIFVIVLFAILFIMIVANR